MKKYMSKLGHGTIFDTFGRVRTTHGCLFARNVFSRLARSIEEHFH